MEYNILWGFNSFIWVWPSRFWAVRSWRHYREAGDADDSWRRHWQICW